ncbi:MAG: asparagine synthase (glutamine-hydrolyzing) [Flavobacteriales bacterium AspAUS03]
MCGIAGYIDWQRREDTCCINAMVESLKHRGPDDQGSEIYESPFAKIYLGQSRLSIIDLSPAGHQPMSYDSYHIVFNGEVYNYQTIRKELMSLGHLFHSHSDTEVILHAFAQWREKAVDRFIGMFAFVIYDNHQEKVYLFRDRAGVKPLYYFHHNGFFIFGSELKVLVAHKNFPRNIDLNAAGLFFKYGYILAPHTIYQNTFKLIPGSYLEIDLKSQNLLQRKYWDVLTYYGREKRKIPFVQAKEELHKLLIDAFKLRLVGDVPVGVFLSGGYDSSIVAAILSRHSNEKINTFTIGFEDKAFDEAPHAKKIAVHLGTEHMEYYCMEKETINIIPDLSYHYDEPFFDISSIPSILLSRITRKKVKVALSADAGDEIFAGYNSYKSVLQYTYKLRNVPKIFYPILSDLSKCFSNLLPKNQIRYKHRLIQISNLFKERQNLGVYLLDSISQTNNIETVQKIFNTFVQVPCTKLDEYNLVHFPLSVLEQAMALGFLVWLPDMILCKVDRATMSASLEGREPLLDHRIIEYVAQLPNDFKYYKGIQKHILREICYEYIPKKIMNRPKQGFVPPLKKWLRNELKDYLLDMLNDNVLSRYDFLDKNYVMYCREEFLKGNDQFYNIVWGCMVFLSWGDRWMKK